MALQGPHQEAQKSVMTMRDEERIWERCWGEVMAIVFDILATAVQLLRRRAGGDMMGCLSGVGPVETRTVDQS